MSSQSPPPSPTYARATSAFNASSSHDWTSEKKLLSALTLLQDLESRTQHLRTLLPNRLFLPLDPIVDHKRQTPRNPLPRNPAELYDRLAASSRDAVRELDAFRADFSAPAVRTVLGDVDAFMKRAGNENGNAKGNGTGTAEPVPVNTHWTRLYDANLRALLRREEEAEKLSLQKSQRERLEEVVRRDGDGWRDAVVRFGKRFEGELEIVLPQQQQQQQQQQSGGPSEEEEFTVRFVRRQFSLRFRRRSLVSVAFEHGGGEWVVVVDENGNENANGRGDVDDGQQATFKSQVLEALDARDKKWDVAYLITLLHSYTPMNPQKCNQCNQILDGNAHLPISRKPVEDNTAPAGGVRWLPCHPGCL